MKTRNLLSPLRIVVALGACLALCGCQMSSPKQSMRLVPSPRPFEADIPVPAGFRFVEQASEDRSTGTTRLYLRHVYRGEGNKYEVRNFYREQMPLARWVKVSDGNVKGEYNMRFEKGLEACNIRIQSAPSNRDLTEIQVIISQEERGASPPAARNRT